MVQDTFLPVFCFGVSKCLEYVLSIIEWLRLEGTQSQLPRTMSRWLLNFSKDGDSTSSLGNLCPCSVNLTVEKVFPNVQREPPVFRFVPVASGPVTGHH